jgi:hypothetical protein
LLARRTPHAVNITDEALAAVVAPIAAVLDEVVAVPIAAVAVDSTAGADTTAARVFVAGCLPHHGK